MAVSNVTESKKETNRLQSPIFRVSFPKLVTADKFDKFSVTAIFPQPDKMTEGDRERWKAMIALAHAKKDAKWADKKGGWAGVKSPFRQGIADDGNNGGYDLVKYPEYAGNVICSFGSKSRPIPVVDRNRVELIGDALKQEVYPGCYAIAFITCFTSENEGVKRVSFGCQSIMKVKDGTPLMAVVNPEEDYKEVDLDEYGVDNADQFSDGDDLSI